MESECRPEWVCRTPCPQLLAQVQDLQDELLLVMVELPLPGAGMVGGLKVTVAFEGKPEADRAMELLKPPLMVVVIVEAPWLLYTMLSEAGAAEMAKLGWVTVSMTVAVCWSPPPLPVTVMG
jgi:hypothetical protein